MTDCNTVPGGVYDCTHLWGENCTNGRNFELASLWNITKNILQYCATDPRLVQPAGSHPTLHNAALTQNACESITNGQWKYYPAADIWTRLVTWKFPLLQLVFQFSRPPLSLRAEFFAIVHLLGDPVDTIRNLIYTLSNCQRRAQYWKKQFSDTLLPLIGDKPDREWKALALITISYDEWGQGDKASKILYESL